MWKFHELDIDPTIRKFIYSNGYIKDTVRGVMRINGRLRMTIAVDFLLAYIAKK